MVLNPFVDHRSFRAKVVDDLRRELFGPSPADAPEHLSELIAISPLQKYSTGVLFPQRVAQNVLEDTVLDDGTTVDKQDDGDVEERSELATFSRAVVEDATSDIREPLNLANEFSPSAIGISFCLR